jgi:hypothetical protein
MKPILFPYTYVTDATTTVCCHFFGGLAVYQTSMTHVPETMRKAADKGILDLILPDPQHSKEMDAILADIEKWTRYHGGGVTSFLKGYQDQVPFFGSSSVSQIKQDIQSKKQGVSHGAPQEDPRLRAGIFLQMAQEFDIHNLGLCHQMQQHDSMEKNLFRELKGDDHSSHGTPEGHLSYQHDDPFEFMIMDRLTAWSQVMQAHGHVQGPLVTTHASVLSLIQDHIPDTLILAATVPEIQGNGGTGKKEQQDLVDHCQHLIRTPWSQLNDSGLLNTYPAESTGQRSLKLYLVPGITTDHFIAGLADGTMAGGHGAADDMTQVNTLIGTISGTTD